MVTIARPTQPSSWVRWWWFGVWWLGAWWLGDTYSAPSLGQDAFWTTVFCGWDWLWFGSRDTCVCEPRQPPSRLLNLWQRSMKFGRKSCCLSLMFCISEMLKPLRGWMCGGNSGVMSVGVQQLLLAFPILVIIKGTIWLVTTYLVQKNITGNKLIQYHNFVLNKYINVSLIILLSVNMAVTFVMF